MSMPVSSERQEAPLFSDGLGDRVVAVDGATGDLLQILRLRPALLTVPSFEFALRERTARLANFRHTYYARVRRVDRHAGGLAIVADHVEGTRLSEILRVAAERRLHLDLNAALCLVRQLVPAVALLHENARDVAHGLLAPERIIVTPHARVVLAEHVLGSAVEQLQYPRERLWQELRVALPPSAGAPRFDHRADVTGLGLVALALVMGRPLRSDEYPHRIATLLNEARARSAMGDEQPLSPLFRSWIARALQLDLRNAFASATEAQAALEEVLASDAGYVAAPVALETFLSRYITALLEPVLAPAPPPAPSAASVDAALRTHTSPPPPAPPAAMVSFTPSFNPVPPPPVVPAPPVTPPVETTAPVVAEPPMTGAVVQQPAVSAPLFAPSTPSPLAPPLPPMAAAAPIAGPSTKPFGDRFEPAAAAAALRDVPDITELIGSLGPPLVDDGRPSGLDAIFEGQDASHKKAARLPLRKRLPAVPLKRIGLAAAVVVVLGTLGFAGRAAWRTYHKPAGIATGVLSVQTNPPGVSVFVDGVEKGATPARLSLPAGSHIVELRGRGVPRVLPVSITAGSQVSQYLELPETPSTGSLLVQSQPAGAKVTIDGVERGVAPVSVADLQPGEHEVVLQAEGGVVRQKVVIQAGVTASVLAPVSTAAAGPVSGWLSIKAPVTLDVKEGGRLLGSTDTDRIMMTAGRHDLELTNETLGYHATRTVQVPPGRTAPVAIDLPQGVINLNASPWAEVFIDGKRVGETPIGNLAVPIGPHEVIFRNPQFGEKRHAVSVTLNGPVRLSVDMK